MFLTDNREELIKLIISSSQTNIGYSTGLVAPILCWFHYTTLNSATVYAEILSHSRSFSIDAWESIG